MNTNYSMSLSNNFPKLDAATIGDLWYFRTAARLCNFSAAAQELHVTQGAISQRMRHLEERIGAKLFVRIGRGISLTAEGDALYRVVSGSFLNIEAGIGAVLRDHAQRGIVVSCAPSLAMEWLLPRLGNWQRLADDAKIRIRAEFHVIDRETLINEGVEVAIRYDNLDYDDLNVIELYEEKIFPVCTPDFWKANGCFSRAEDLADVTLLHDASPWAGAPPFNEWRSWTEEVGAKIDVSQGEQFNLAQMAVRASLFNQGVAMGRSQLVEDYLRDGRLIRPFGACEVPGAKYRFMTPGHMSQTSVVARLAGWMKAEMNSAKPSSGGFLPPI